MDLVNVALGVFNSILFIVGGAFMLRGINQVNRAESILDDTRKVIQLYSAKRRRR